MIYTGMMPGERITPACAGKRSVLIAFQPPVQDHPRVCGEKDALSDVMQAHRGSPPRVRGKVNDLTGDADALRITPACAGKRALPTD